MKDRDIKSDGQKTNYRILILERQIKNNFDSNSYQKNNSISEFAIDLQCHEIFIKYFSLE